MSETTTKRAARAPMPAAPEAEIEEASPGGVQSLARAFAILEEVARHRDGIGLSDLCRKVGLHSSTTFHLIKTMVSLGYVRQLPDSKRYRLGRPVFMLAAQSLDEVEMVSVATPFLEELSALTDESAIFAVRMNEHLAILARSCGTGPFQAADHGGAARPLHTTAAGKVLLAGMTAERFEAYLRRAEWQARTPRSITSPEALRAEIMEVRRSGMAIENGEYWPEVHAIAVGVHDFTARLVGAVSLSGPLWRQSADVVAERAALLRETAGRISQQFGYSAADHSGC